MNAINVFWFKRDLRLVDNPALDAALSDEKALLLLYILEPSLETDPHYDVRHFRFIKESLKDLNESLKMYRAEVLCVYGEVVETLKKLTSILKMDTLYSTLETGIIATFERDVRVKAFCKSNGICWIEHSQNAVSRGRKNRNHWRQALNEFLSASIHPIALNPSHFISEKQFFYIKKQFLVFELTTPMHFFQKGGRAEAMICARWFFSNRIQHYSDYISKPEMSRYGCSRLSPYIAWGNISVREVYQMALAKSADKKYGRQLKAFMSRLRWQSHFIQKFESETRMQIEAVNRGFCNLDQPVNEKYINAWKTGTTGYPLVDASIQAVKHTGYINFRMRALIISFLTHHLFQPFTTGSAWLAQQFLDFEPGIHYGQMQMQAGLTGINTVRVYNPTKNAHDHDPDASFIKEYLPALKDLPPVLAIEPWNITSMEEAMYNFQYGKDYPYRIVDISDTRKKALTRLYGQRKTALAKAEIERILDRHTLHKTETRFP